MFKTKEEVIIIQAEAKEPIATRAVFWSHDKGTAKMLFKLRKDGTSQALAEGTIVPIVLKFNSETAEGGIGRHIYHAVIEDAVNGIVSIVLEDNILGYQGRVDGSIYIELPDSRSLDTAGRFTFHIKHSPIDEDVPELEDYYWQGFSDIMEQYHESIAEIKSEAKELLDSLTADVTKVKNDIATANTRIDEINQKIDDNDVFTKAESSANVIYQVVGKEKVSLRINSDIKSSVGAYTIGYSSLSTPSHTWKTLSENELKLIDALDDSILAKKDIADGYIMQIRFQVNILESFKSVMGQHFFEVMGMKTDIEILDYLKHNIISPTANVFGFGSGNNVKRLNIAIWSNTASEWQGKIWNASTNVSKLSRPVQNISSFVSDDGVLNYIAFAEAGNVLNPSTVNIDYFNFEYALEISTHDFINSMIAANHVQNLATQSEAETGTDNTKTMTPLRTKQLLDSKLLNMVYPIGSIYMSVNSATPATLFGGTWERFSNGRVLVGVNETDTALATSGKQGGSANGIAEHTHTFSGNTGFASITAGVTSGADVSFSTSSSGQGLKSSTHTHAFSGTTASVGSNADHANWQPFITVYMWKRTA